jgi:Rieske Fe-S protein
VGVVALLAGVVVSWVIVAIGAAIAAAFAFLWIRDIARGRAGADGEPAPDVAPETRATRPQPAARPAAPAALSAARPVSRSAFLEASTLGLGAVIGGLVTLPVLGFAVMPSFLNQAVPGADLGPLSDYPEGLYVITTFTSDKAQGFVSRQTAFVRYNGLLGNLPSFTILSSRCVHLGCPVQPNGEVQYPGTLYKDVRQIKVAPSGFGCPCHDSQYDDEGNRTSGPAPRALNRYSFSIVNDHLMVGSQYSVSHVVGTGAQAKIYATTYAFPGEPVSGLESWLYPIQPPH